MLFILALLMGFVLAIPVGPAGVRMIQASLIQKSYGFFSIVAFVLTEVAIFSVCFYFFKSLNPLFHHPFAKIAVGAFFLLFFYNSKLQVLNPQMQSALRSQKTLAKVLLEIVRITLLNPSAWVSMVILLTIVPYHFSIPHKVLWFLFFEAGTVFWFWALLSFVLKVSAKVQLKIQRYSINIVGLLGFVSLCQGAWAFAVARL